MAVMNKKHNSRLIGDVLEGADLITSFIYGDPKQ